MRLPRFSSFAIMMLVVSIAFLASAPIQPVKADLPPGAKGGLILHTVPPHTVCVGDTFTVEGGTFVTLPEVPGADPNDPLAGMSVIQVTPSAVLGTVTPDNIVGIGEDMFFSFSYTAKSAGEETIRATLNEGMAFDQLKFKVENSCAYDAFLVSVLDFTADVGDFTMHTLTNMAGTGTMKRVRSTSDALQGDGTWHLEENMLNSPPECVQWYMPPLILSGPFELDAELFPEDETVNVILAFKPRTGPPVYHGKSICVDVDGNQGEGWGIIPSGGNESLAAKIKADFPIGGGSQPVEMTGAGMQIVQSQGSLEYTATLTIIPK